MVFPMSFWCSIDFCSTYCVGFRWHHLNLISKSKLTYILYCSMCNRLIFYEINDRKNVCYKKKTCIYILQLFPLNVQTLDKLTSAQHVVFWTAPVQNESASFIGNCLFLCFLLYDIKLQQFFILNRLVCIH